MSVHPVLQLWFAGRAARFRARGPRPAGPPRIEVPGLDPVRVLVTGAGLAAGYGVLTQEASLAGAVADGLARGSGRGVVVEVRAAALLPGRRILHHLGPEGASGFDVAIFAPCYLEAPVAPDAGVRRHGAAVQRHLLATGPDDLRLVMVGVPRPSRFSRLDLAAAESATDANTVMRHLADLDERVDYVEPPTFTSVRAEHPFDAGYYRAAAAPIVATLLPRFAT